MKKVSIAVVVAAVLVVTGIVQGQSKTDPMLNKMATEWAATYNAKDAAKLAGFYAENAVYMPSNQPMVKGRAAIRAHFTQEFQQGSANLKLTPMESAISGSQAYEAGTATITVPGGRLQHDKYVVVFKQVGGAWKIAYDINNTDQPAPPSK
jgi:uncharacterized protein (TIGR02246 family)